MPLLAWIALGLIIGFVGSKFLNKTGEGLPMDVVVGIGGAVVGGLLFNAVLAPTAVGMNPWNLSVAAIGSVGVFWVWHAFIRSA